MPFIGVKTSVAGATLTKNGNTAIGPFAGMCGAIGAWIRVWVDKDIPLGLASISGTTLTLPSAPPVYGAATGTGTAYTGKLGVNTKITGAGVTAGTVITVATSATTYTVNNSQTVGPVAMVANNASTTGKITSVSFWPPAVDGTQNYVTPWSGGWTAIGSLTAVPYVGSAYGVPPALVHTAFMPVASTPNGYAPWPFATAWMSLAIDNTDTANDQTCVNVEVWPVYSYSGGSASGNTALDHFTTLT